jgi:uncharacterized membrane protein
LATRLEHSVFVNAPVENVESVLYDGYRLPEWVVGVTQAQPDDAFPNPGGAVQLVYSVAGVNFPVTLYSVEIAPGQSATTQFEGAINGSNAWTFQPDANGTWVTCIFEYDVPGGSIGQAIDRMMFEKKNAENLERGLNNLKALAES